MKRGGSQHTFGLVEACPQKVKGNESDENHLEVISVLAEKEKSKSRREGDCREKINYRRLTRRRGTGEGYRVL